MIIKKNSEHDEEALQPRLSVRRAKSIFGRTLITSLIIFVVLTLSILYYGFLLEHLDQFKQTVGHERNHQDFHKTENLFIEIPDNEIITIEDQNSVTQSIIDNESLLRLQIQHGKMAFSRRRLSRDITELDPLFLEKNFNFQELKSKVRNKRTRIALSKLEKEYLRCKKAAHHNNECVVEFVKLYKVAKDLSEKMDKMVEMFKDSEQFLYQQNSKSNTEEQEINNESFETNIDNFDDALEIPTTKKNKNFKSTTKKLIETSTTAIEKATTMTITSSSSISTSTTTPTPTSTTTTIKSIKIKPIRYSWIIDGHDDVEETTEKSTTQESTTEKSTSSIEPEITEIDKINNHTTKSSTKTDDFGWILNVKFNDSNKTKAEITTTSKETLVRTTKSTLDTTKHKDGDDDDADNSNNNADDEYDEIHNSPNDQQLFISKKISAEKTEKSILTSTTPNTIEIDQERLRKLKFDWILDGGEDLTDADKSKIETTNAPLNIKSTTIITTTKMYPTKPKIIKYDWIVDSDINSAELMRSNNNVTTTTTEHTIKTKKPHLNKADFLRDPNGTHPLDNPTSLENYLDSFEKSDLLRPFNNQTDATEKMRYDPILWAKKFKEAAVKEAQDELLDTFGEIDFQNASKLGPKLNPANMKALNDESAEILSLCERMAKRLRAKVGANNTPEAILFNFTQNPNSEFTGRGPGNFPATAESMKSSAQFMFNTNYGPNFGIPSIPICFYLTPANYRMPGHMTNMWGQPYFGMPNYYNGMSSGAGGGGGGVGVGLMNQGFGVGPTSGGVFVVPQNFGGFSNIGNNFNQMGGVGTGSSQQNNGPNIFPKNISPQNSKPQQFYCTYMQNSSNQGTSGNPTNIGGTSGFSNSNFKLRTSANQTTGVGVIYASYAGMPTQQEVQFKCQLPDQIACYGGNECVQEASWCDGIVDCSDASDEAACSCQDRLTEDRICDGYPDCPMGEDEIGCYGCDKFMYSCYANNEEYKLSNRSTISMCYSSMERCDGYTNCLNGRDELECNVLVNDFSNHMSHSVSTSEGFLFHNHRGQWYPVCNNPEKWANDACRDEGGYLSAPNVTYRELTLPGPFIEPSIIGDAHFPHSCQKRNAQNTLVNHATYVKCAICKCGYRKKTTEYSLKLKSKRSKQLQKRIVETKNQENNDGEVASEERIVGGKYSKPLEWPFVVAIYRNGKFHCGGTIYNERWIISAAHCAINYQNYYYEVRAGLLRRSSYSAATQIRPVSDVVVHQAYERKSMRNDLSLMHLAEPLYFNRWIKPICMPDMGRTTSSDDWIWGPDPHTLCTAVGWGAIREKGPGSEPLREVIIPILKRCTETVDQLSESICAGEADGGRDACQGDSGGPLFCRSVSNLDEWYLAGVVSHGNGCARPGEYGVYTRVALYLDWVEMATNSTFLPELKPKQICPGFICVWGGKRCIPESKRCNRVVDCLGGEDEVGCVYNFIPDVGSAQNSTTTESDYFPESESTTEKPTILQETLNTAQAEKPTTTQSELKNIDDSIEDLVVFVTDSPKTTENIENTAFELEDIMDSTSSELTTEGLADAKPIKFNLGLDTETRLTTPELTSPASTMPTSTESVKKFITTSQPPVTTTTEISTEKTKLSDAKEISTTTQPKAHTIPQLPEKFICRKIPQIIEQKHRCDNHIDCEDGTDEENCSCVDYLKVSHSILICDGKADCEDSADEKDCGSCQENEFRCHRSKQCIPMTRRCNNLNDCLYKEDENDCFALTNGRELKMDVNRQPLMSNVGIFTQNIKGVWHVVCSHEINFEEQRAAAARDICSYLGFRGFKFYNTTSDIPHDHIVVPIDPELTKKERIKAHLASSLNDNLDFKSNEQLFPIEGFKKTNTERVIHGAFPQHGKCLGVYIECNPASNKTEPLKTLGAGDKLTIDDGESNKMKPAVITNARPNVFIKPLTKDSVEKPKEIIESKKNVSVLVNNKLHEAVEELHWPWLVDIYANGKLWCVGVLLDKSWVLVHESCYFGIRLNTDNIVALLGGGKTKQAPHKSPNEQIRRIDCFQSVPNSDVLVYHLERPAHLTHHILPTFLPDNDEILIKKSHANCIAILHDDETGRIKAVPIKREKQNETCSTNDMSCYRLMEHKQPPCLPLDTDVHSEELARISDEMDWKLPNHDLKISMYNALTKFTSCSQFGNRKTRSILEPVDQGILVCRDTVGGWYPTALFSYNNTDCRSFKESFGVRTLENVYEVLQDTIEQTKCMITYAQPNCETFRCPLGKCLASDEVCNGKNDCHDGSDEDATFCLKYKKECEPSEMQCRSTKKCIPKTKFCDHVPDCEDLTDEPTVCSCFTYLRATDPSKICDGIRNCWDKSDESPAFCNCTKELFHCGITSNECIPHDFVCDKESDCPNGEDERYCYGIEQPILHPAKKNSPFHNEPHKPPKYGQVIEQTYGIWHTKCFPRSSPPDISEIRQICRKLGYTTHRLPSYRLIDDEANEVVESNVSEPELLNRSFSNASIAGIYRQSTKAVVVSKFSPLHLNDELTLFIKPSRPIAELVRWNATDSSRCFRLEIRCS